MWKRDKIGSTSWIVFDHVSPFIKITKESLTNFLEKDDGKGGMSMYFQGYDEDEQLLFDLSPSSDMSRVIWIVRNERDLDHIPS